MTAPERVRVTHVFKSDPQTVFEKLAEHENLGPVFGAKITRVSDGTSSRNGGGLGPPAEDRPAARVRGDHHERRAQLSDRVRDQQRAVRSRVTGVARSSRPPRTAAPSSCTRSGSTRRCPEWPAWSARTLTSSLTKGLPRLTD